MGQATIRQELHIEASKEIVWKAWTDPSRVEVWFAPSAFIEPFEGGRYELYFDPANKERMSTKECKILTLEEPRKLVFEWKGPDPFANIMNMTGALTAVEVLLEPAARDSTLVKLCHSGWGEEPEWQQAKAWHVEAWKQVLGSLKTAVESGQGDLCCI